MFIKICGITNERDALNAIEFGADALGFIFAESPRKVSVSVVANIVKQIPEDFMTFGVFRDHDSPQVIETVRNAGLKGAQLHGHESSHQVKEVMADVGWVIKSVVAGSQEARNADNYATNMILVDSVNPGSGTSYDLNLIKQIPVSIRLLLSGGLTVANVARSIEAVNPWGVDVCSGVEHSPGLKNESKMEEFITNARSIG